MAAGDEDAPRDLTSTVVRGVSFAAGGFIAAQILNLAFYIALARLLEPADFGEFAAATVLIGFTLLLTESGMASAVIQRRTEVEAAASTAAFATFVAGVVFSLLALATAPLVGAFFDSSTVTALAAASSGTILLRSLGSVPDALLQRRFSFLRRLVIEPATVIGFGVAAVIAATADLGPWALVIGQYAGFTIDAALSWILVRWRPSPSLASYSMWRELVGYGRHVLVATAILHAGEQASTLIVGRALGSGPLGQFRYALRLASMPFALLLAGAAYVLFPAFSRIAEDVARLRGAFMRSLRWVCLLAFPAGLVFVPLGEPLTVTVFGEVWRPAGEALIAMCLFPAGGMLASVVSEALKAIGEPRLLTRMHAMTSGVTIAAMLALIPAGLTAVAAGMSIGAMAGGFYALVLARNALEIPLATMLREVIPIAIAATVAALAIVPLELWVVDAASHGTAVSALLLVAEALAGLVVYVGLLALLAPAAARELATALAEQGLGSRASAVPTPTSPSPSLSTRHSRPRLRPMPEPRFSVIVPAYNGSATIAETIESVLAQSEAGLELIVVDDGSADDTVAVVNRFRSDSRLQLIEQENQGTAAARNTGIGAARGEYVAFLDNDDLWMPEYLAEAGIALDREPGAGFAYCDAWGFDDATRRFLRRTELESRPDAGPGADYEATLEQLVRVNFVMSSVCTRRSVLNELGGFDAKVRGTDDYDLWLRIMLAGHGAVRAGDRPLLLQRGRHDSQSADESMMDRNLRLVLERVVDNPRSAPAVVRAARERIAEVDRALARHAGLSDRAANTARRVRDALMPDRRWLERPPAEVARAFPDLVRT